MPHLSHPGPHLLVAKDFAVVEDLNLEHLIAVDAAGHWPPEGLGREGQLWPWVEMTGRGEGSGRGPLLRQPLASARASQGPSSHLESHLIPAPPCHMGTAQSFVKDGARKVQQSSQGPMVSERTQSQPGLLTQPRAPSTVSQLPPSSWVHLCMDEATRVGCEFGFCCVPREVVSLWLSPVKMVLILP